MATLTEIQQSLNHRVNGPAETLVERLAQQFGTMVSASAVYGAPIERGGVTVIPVAVVRFGFGAGASAGPERPGSGGGGGASASPIGYIELRDGTASFRPIRTPDSLLVVVPVILAAALNTWVILRGLRRLLRR